MVYTAGTMAARPCAVTPRKVPVSTADWMSYLPMRRLTSSSSRASLAKGSHGHTSGNSGRLPRRHPLQQSVDHRPHEILRNDGNVVAGHRIPEFHRVYVVPLLAHLLERR